MARLKNRAEKRFVLCIWNEEGETDLEVLKVYRQLPDQEAETEGMIRVIDESGEDYLYPQKYFIPLELPKSVEKIVAAAAELQPA
ncbi:MAG TPA: hypothetical protein VGX94_14100 [Terriglobia bacterium]|nr:hypothetical protein [Terriglobia bacterium]